MGKATKAGKRFSLDGEAVDLGEFLSDNAEVIGSEEIARIHALEVGESMNFGGGAGASFVLRREPIVFKMVPPFKDTAEDRAAVAAARFGVKLVHLDSGWKHWAFERLTGRDVEVGLRAEGYQSRGAALSAIAGVLAAEKNRAA